MTFKTRLQKIEQLVGITGGAGVPANEIANLDPEARRLKDEVSRLLIDKVYADNDVWASFCRMDNRGKAEAFCLLIENDPECGEAWDRYQARLDVCRADDALMAKIRSGRRK